MSPTGTFELLVLELSRALGKITDRLGDELVLDTFEELGVRFPRELLDNAAFNTARGTIVTAGGRLGEQVSALEQAIDGGDAAEIAGAALALATTIGQLTASFAQLAGAIQAVGPSLPGITQQQVDDLAADLPERLLDLLLFDLLDRVRPVSAALEVFGVIERQFRPGDPNDPSKPDHDRVTLHPDRLIPAVTNPVAQLQTLYGWGDPGFDAAALLTVLESALGAIRLPVLLRPAAGGEPVMLEAFAVDLRPTASGPPGLQIDIVLPASLDRTFTFPLSPPTWNAEVTARAAVLARASGAVRPPFEVTLGQPSGELSMSTDVTVSATPPTPLILLGEAGGSRLELAGVTLGGGGELEWDSGTHEATGGPTAHGSITGGRLVIDASRGDGFITTLLGGARIESQFALELSFAPSTGLRFEGSGGLEIQVPVHISLGPIDVSSIYLSAGLSSAVVPVELSVAMSAQLGPLAASVDRIGAIARIGFPPGGGNAGPAQIAIEFKPPTGVGLAIDAAVVKGGGFLSIDTARGEYAGALQLELAEFLAVSAIGLISTRNPDGSPGFSLLIIITADFGPGIQLGFGFTLNAVGGLLGLNRKMLFGPLMDGVRSGSIESVMFPRDVVANAPRIISDLRAIFPPQPGTFLIGPMAKLGWGQPTIVSASLGVIIQIPPGDIALLGVLKIVLPADEIAILKLQVNFAGALEFSKKRLYFFASLYDSRLLFITLQGEMGVLFAYGDDADFVLSIGGFHPQFSPPPLPFPSPRRIQIDVINESFARIRCEGYFALTTNTLQFGSHAEMFFGFSALSVEGHSSFDALIQFSPFHLTVHISTSFCVRVFGIGVWGLDIDLNLDGPNPWHARGTASISLLFFSIDVDVDVTWGDARDTALPPVAVMPLVGGELAKRSNWKAQPPPGSGLRVSLRELAPAEAELVLHPVGTLQVSQRLVPLDLTLDRIGSQRPSDANRFALAASAGLAKVRDLEEPFAPAQFKDADDATKLSQPAYEPEHSGIELAPAGQAYDSATALTRIVRYDLTIVDTKLRPPVRLHFFIYAGALFQHWLGGASVAHSVLSAHHAGLTHPYDGSVAVEAETFFVANVADNTATHAESFRSRAAAVDHLQRVTADDPGLAGSLHVLPSFEVAA